MNLYSSWVETLNADVYKTDVNRNEELCCMWLKSYVWTEQEMFILVFPVVVSEQLFIVAEQDSTMFGSDDDPNGHNGCFEAWAEIQRCSFLLVVHIYKQANWRADQHSGFFDSLYRLNDQKTKEEVIEKWNETK